MKKKKAQKTTRKKPQPRFSYTTLGVICIIGATLCFAFQGIIIKTLFTHDVSVTAMLLWRQVIFLPFYLLYLGCTYPEGLKPMGKDTFSIMAVGSLGFFFIPLTNSTALHHIEAGVERILLYTYPLFVVLITAIYTKRLPARQHILAFIVIQMGIFLLIGGGESLEKLYIGLMPALQVIFAAVMFAIYTLLIKKWVEKYGSHRFFLWGVLGSLILITINFLIQESPMRLPSAEAWFFLTLMTLISFPPSILFAEGVKRIGSTRASFISTLGPVATLIFADILLGERLGISQVVGGAVVMAMVSALEAPALRNFIRVLRTRKK